MCELEHILGLGPSDKIRKVPGTTCTEEREYRYVKCSHNANTATLFKKLIRKVDPPLATSGGAINEGCIITLPSDECYFAISYKGDIEGWRQQIEKGAANLGLSVARVSENSLVLAEGDEVLLSECAFKFY
ncbi:hypothetical protein [Halalkalibacter sp. APA_J-10(15)]|uniref:hypothetical protein n=1 Tax=unclassified Halalkalibacter TaxID=2893063 RepID=UPI001FF6B683|nr:hypothetical protein [Halalkalibacter sp. APA_J-10(15)]MCK0471167.1 hypothetical protein [Halalkalibacter sp. APA_J-10(15)]